MANGFTPVGQRDDYSQPRRQVGDLLIDSYPSGGYTPVPSQAGLKTVDHIGAPVTNNGYTLRLVGGKVRAYTGASGSPTVTDLFPDVKGGVSADHLTDQASEGVNAHYVMGATAGNDATLNGAGVSTGLTNPDVTRNLNLGLSSVGGATAVAGNIVVTGTDRDGNPLTESVAIIPGAIAAGKFRNRRLVKPFATVTLVQSDTPQPADILVSIGLGTKVALRTNLKTPASGDVKAVTKGGNAVAYTVDTTYNAVAIGVDLADNDDLVAEYAVAGSGGTLTQEATAATNLGTARCEFVGQ